MGFRVWGLGPPPPPPNPKPELGNPAAKAVLDAEKQLYVLRREGLNGDRLPELVCILACHKS